MAGVLTGRVLFVDKFIWNGRDTLAALLRLICAFGHGDAACGGSDGSLGFGFDPLFDDLDGCLWGAVWCVS